MEEKNCRRDIIKDTIKYCIFSLICAPLTTFAFVTAIIHTNFLWGWVYTGDATAFFSERERECPAAVATLNPSSESYEQGE